MKFKFSAEKIAPPASDAKKFVGTVRITRGTIAGGRAVAAGELHEGVDAWRLVDAGRAEWVGAPPPRPPDHVPIELLFYAATGRALAG